MSYFFVPTSGHTDLELVSTSVWLTIKKQENNLTNDYLETWLCAGIIIQTGVCPYLPTNVCTFIRMYEPTYIPMGIHTYLPMYVPTYICILMHDMEDYWTHPGILTFHTIRPEKWCQQDSSSNLRSWQKDHLSASTAQVYPNFKCVVFASDNFPIKFLATSLYFINFKMSPKITSTGSLEFKSIANS